MSITIKKIKIGTYLLIIIVSVGIFVYIATSRNPDPLPSANQTKTIGYTKDYVTKHGGAEIIMYSTSPGSTTTYHVYASKGFALILDKPGATNVFEKWEFDPMTVEEFKERYKATVQDTLADLVKLDTSQFEQKVYDGNTGGNY